jgi:hypothetical protein
MRSLLQVLRCCCLFGRLPLVLRYGLGYAFVRRVQQRFWPEWLLFVFAVLRPR